jgi:hypothetical protein
MKEYFYLIVSSKNGMSSGVVLAHDAVQAHAAASRIGQDLVCRREFTDYCVVELRVV